MISRLKGIFLEHSDNVIVIDVAGVGYEVEVTASVLTQLPSTQMPLDVFTHLVVREDAQLLYGFVDRQERDLFRTFIRISGVGPKLALAILSSIDIATLARAVEQNQVGMLTKIPGVGKKTAERLMLELKSKLAVQLEQMTSLQSSSAGRVTQPGQVSREAVDALVALGYRSAQAQQAVEFANAHWQETKPELAEPTTEELVTVVLRTFGKGS